MDPLRIIWLIGILTVSLFVHLIYTEDFSVPKHFLLTWTAVVTFLVLLAKLVRKPRSTVEFELTVFHLLFMVFWVFSIISLTNVARDNPSLLRYSLDVSLYLFVFVFLSVFFSNYVDTIEKMKKLLLTFLVAGFIIAINAILNYYTGYDVFIGLAEGPLFRERIRSCIGNVIFVTNFLNMLLPVSIYLSVFKDDETDKIVQSFALVCSVLFFYVLQIGQVRSEFVSWGAQLVMLSIFLIAGRFNRKKAHDSTPSSSYALRVSKVALTILMFAFLAVVLAYYTTPNALNHYKVLGKVVPRNIESRFQAPILHEDFTRRLVAWLSALELWKKHKILGQGAGSYKYYGGEMVSKVCNNRPEYKFAWQPFDKVHNDYLQVLAETGIVGFTLLLILLLTLLIYAVSNFLKLGQSEKTLFACLVISTTPFIVQMFFSFPTQILPNSLLALFLVSCGVGVVLNKQQRLRLKLSLSWRKALISGILILLILLGSAYLRTTKFLSDVYLRKGKVALYNYSLLLSEQTSEDNIAMVTTLGNTSDGNESADKSSMNPEDDFEVALESFVKSVKLNPWNGASYFYLEKLAWTKRRFMWLKDAFKTSSDMILAQNFDAIHKVIPPESKLSVFDLLGDLSQRLLVEAKDELITIQVNLDGISLLETARKTFPDPLIHLGLAKLSSNIASILHELSERFSRDPEVKKALEVKSEKWFEKLASESMLLVNYISGGWTQYWNMKSPDIFLATFRGEDFYRSLLNYILTSGPIDPRRLQVFRKISDIELQYCSDLEKTGYWGVPDGGFIYLLSLSKRWFEEGRRSESVELLRDLIRKYGEMYEIARAKVTNRTFFEANVKGVLNFVKESIRRDFSSLLNPELMASTLSIFEEEYWAAVKRFETYDFGHYVRLYISELASEDPRNWGKIYATSPWRHFQSEAAKMVIRRLNENVFFQKRPAFLAEMLNVMYLTIDPSVARPVFIHERYVLFKNFYELATKLLDELSRHPM